MRKLICLAGLFFYLTVFAETASEKLSFDFQKITIRDLISILAQYSEKNIILSDKVSAQEISLHLKDVSWDEALTVILSSQGLAKRQVGNTLIIAPVSEITQQVQQQIQYQVAQGQDEDLETRLITLKYAKANDLMAALKDKNNLFSTKGSFGVDVRTNSIWIEDISSQLDQIQTLISELDKPAQQVSIEARIVTVDSNYEKDLGIKFGVSGGHHLSGSLAGANALAEGKNPTSIPLKDRLNFDFPSSPTVGGSGTLGLALFKLADGYMLDLELSALQAEGAGEIIAKPSLITQNQQAAVIRTGQDIPYQEKTSSGATNVNFKKAVLSLEVTPQITPDQHILLTLHINQDKPSSRLINGVPAIDTREMTTQVLVKDQQTIVLGGIYEEADDHQIERVPFISDIPVIGKLFEHQHEQKEKRELLIFVRPKIQKDNLSE
jgi:type IV pilus assembly protein PilQ